MIQQDRFPLRSSETFCMDSKDLLWMTVESFFTCFDLVTIFVRVLFSILPGVPGRRFHRPFRWRIQAILLDHVIRKEPIQRMGKRNLGTAMYLDVSLSMCDLRAMDSGKEKAELTFRWSLALLLLSLATTTVPDQSAKRSALRGGRPRY